MESHWTETTASSQGGRVALSASSIAQPTVKRQTGTTGCSPEQRRRGMSPVDVFGSGEWMQRQGMTKETSEAVYRFIREYIETKKYAPTVREIAEGCYLSIGTTMRYLDLLGARGCILRQPGRARSIALPEEDSEA